MNMEEINSLKPNSESRAPPPSPVSSWAVPPSDSSNPNDMFSILDRDHGGKGYLTFRDTAPFLQNCGHHEELQFHMFNLADVNSDGRLTRDEFDIVMHLIAGQDRSKERYGLPDVLPRNLIPPSMRSEAIRNSVIPEVSTTST